MKIHPSDCLFAIQEMDGEWYLVITPTSYWLKESCVYDQHFEFTVKVPFHDVMESVFTGTGTTAQDLYDEAIKYGFVWSEDLTKFIKRLGNKVFKPQSPIGSPVTPVANVSTNITNYRLTLYPFMGNTRPVHCAALALYKGGKINTEICKQVIVEIVNANPGCISHQFLDENDQPPADPLFEGPASLTKNWKRMSKNKSDNSDEWERIFDCGPYDDQLRAYVYTNRTDTIITHIMIVGE